MRVAERGNTKQVHPILHSDEITIAEILKSKGYATACFGKWDLAKHAQEGFFVDLFPTRQGFDYFFGTPTSNDKIANLYRNEELIEPDANMATLTRRYTDEAIDFMRKNKAQPFLVDLEHDLGETTNVADKHPQVTRQLLDLADSMRSDLGDFDRVGKNMRFFDLNGPRPTKPPVP